MTALTAPVAPSPAGVVGRVRWALRDGWVLAQRDVAHWVREPLIIVWGLVFPVVFVLMFAYVFGSGIIVPDGGSYREFLMPGMFAQTMAFGIGETLASVQAEKEKGVLDRFRSLPIAPAALVVGRSMSGMLYSAGSLALLALTGLAVGWRWNGSLAEALAAFGLLLLLRFAFLWIGILLGLKATSPEMANSVFGLLYPVTMLSNAFIAPELMPTPLRVVAEWNPLSATVTATRRLFGNPGADAGGFASDHAILLAVLLPLLLTALTLPLAVRAFRGLSR